MSRDRYEELDLLVEKYLANALDEQESRRLESLVVSEPAAADRFADLVHDHAELVVEAEEHGLSLPENRTPVEARARYSPLAWLGAAAAVAIAAIALWAVRKEAVPETFAVLESTAYSVWGECTLPTVVGGEIGAGRLELREGLATLQFRSGASVTLEGPASLEIVDPMLLRLRSGLAVADVPEQARGFTILTPTAKAVDHGTRFLTRVSPDGETTSVNVLEGEVELVHESTAGREHLFTGEAADASPAGVSRRKASQMEEPTQGESPTVSLPPNTVSVSTADKGGRDATTSAQDSDFHYDPSLVMLKNSQEDFTRKGYVGFDLTGIDLPELSEAELVLTFVSSGYGSAALSRDTEFAVYALTDDSADGWNQGRIPWAEAPANRAGPAELDPDRVEPIGTFILPRGRTTGDVVVGGEKLLERLRVDGNGFVTLVIVVVTPSPEPSSLVFGVAGRRHPSASPPRLRLRFEE